MEVNNLENLEKDITKRVPSLYKEFGKGVHLIWHKKERQYKLMVISGNPFIDILFVNGNNFVSFSKDDYSDFYNYYNYLKKLEPSEISINIKENGE